MQTVLPAAAVSSVNWSENLQKCPARGISTAGLREDLIALGVQIVPFDAADAERAAGLWTSTRHFGLSLDDRACLALALRLNATDYTADRAWAAATTGVRIQVIR